MYILDISAFGPYRRFGFSDAATGNSFSIAPEAGANVLDIRFGGFGILDGHNTPEELEAGKWGKSTVLFPFPNRLLDGQYQWEGKIRQFPVNNAATGNAIHGFVRHHAFGVEKVELTPNHAAILCRLDYKGDYEPYPFPFTLDLRFALHSQSFTLKAMCTNRHKRPIPVGFGWHPYFRLSDRAADHKLQLPLCEKVEIDERMIPTGVRTPFQDFAKKTKIGDTFLDNCFALEKDGAYALTLESGGRSIRMSANSRQCPFFQVFTPPHGESVALEPMSCNVDAFNNREGLVELAPGKTWHTEMGIRFKGEGSSIPF
jgi:aldose 1-epimerase